jgi:hypothetical protein
MFAYSIDFKVKKFLCFAGILAFAQRIGLVAGWGFETRLPERQPS